MYIIISQGEEISLLCDYIIENLTNLVVIMIQFDNFNLWDVISLHK